MSQLRRLAVGVSLALCLAALPAGAAPAPGAPELHGPASFELVGHEPLMNRGMNAALAVHGNYAYVGSRTDGKAGNANNAGIFVVDISTPATPKIVHQIGLPDQGNEGETSREMRVWPEQELLIVQNLGSNCSELIHACSVRKVGDHFAFYDISGENAARPKLVSEYQPSSNPHEFFLWDDPKVAGRALIFISATSGKRLLVTDISGARQGTFKELLSAGTGIPVGALHSLGVSTDGTRGYLAHLTGGFAVLDTSDLAAGVVDPKIRLVTRAQDRVSWPGPGAHSAVKLHGRDFALVTDEVYGELLRFLGGHGCPWGWTRLVDISDPAKPKVVSEYKLPQNDPAFCNTDVPRPSSSYSAHNPTLTKNIAFISWHAGGLQAVSLDDPTDPHQLAEFKPSFLPVVVQEDPALTAGQDKVAMWSYPIIKDGLIYVVDIRNGLYILRYKGPFEDEVTNTTFLEGNSNLGDALLLEPPATDT